MKEKQSSAKKQKVNFYIPPEEAEDLEESKMSIPEDNKLAGLNEMLKKRQFVIQQEDEADFEAFLTKLKSQRSQDASTIERSSPTKQRSERYSDMHE